MQEPITSWLELINSFISLIVSAMWNQGWQMLISSRTRKAFSLFLYSVTDPKWLIQSGIMDMFTCQPWWKINRSRKIAIRFLFIRDQRHTCYQLRSTQIFMNFPPFMSSRVWARSYTGPGRFGVNTTKFWQCLQGHFPNWYCLRPPFRRHSARKYLAGGWFGRGLFACEQTLNFLKEKSSYYKTERNEPVLYIIS